MTMIKAEIRTGAYYDSAFLMQLQRSMAGLPPNTLVAHKFGLHPIQTGSQITGIELHDCGIIYPASNPYILCVMTKGGTQPAALAAAIKGISDLVYREVISGYK